MHEVIKTLESKVVSEFFLEMLDMDAHFRDGQKLADRYTVDEDGLRSNHCICKLMFRDLHVATNTSPETFKGICIDLAFDGAVKESVVSEGLLVVKPFSYDGPHKRSVKIVQIPVRAGKTVLDFLSVVVDNEMIPCAFNTECLRVSGCRDFLSQFVYRLDKARVLDLSANLKQKEVYQTFFNGNFGPGVNERRHDGVGYAAFNDAYHARHHPIKGIDYHGNRISCDSVERGEMSDSE